MASIGAAAVLAAGALFFGAKKLIEDDVESHHLKEKEKESSPKEEERPLYASDFVTKVINPPRGAVSISAVRHQRGAPVSSSTLIQRSAEDTRHILGSQTLADPAYTDQDDWQLDCSGSSCDPSDPRNAGIMPPMRGQYMDREVGTLGDFAPSITGSSSERASGQVEINEDPAPTRSYADTGLGWGEPLGSGDLPSHGESIGETYEDKWGERAWAAETKSFVPDYTYSAAEELDGKEINRPQDTFSMSFDQYGTEAPVDYGTGAASARSADVRLMGRNIYGRFPTRTTAEPKEFLAPMPTRAGNSKPPVEAGWVFGARTLRYFDGFMPWKGAGTKSAPPEPADVVLPAATRRADTYESRLGVATSSGAVYGGEGVNTVEGGRVSRLIDYEPRMGAINPTSGARSGGLDVNPKVGGRIRTTGTRFDLGRVSEGKKEEDEEGVWDTTGIAGARYGAGIGSGVDVNDPEKGSHGIIRSRSMADDDFVYGRRHHGKSGPIMLREYAADARPRKDDDGRAEYQAPGGGVSKYIGHGLDLVYKPRSIITPGMIGKSGGGGAGGRTGIRAGVYTIHGNSAIGTRGAAYSSVPSDVVEDEIGEAAKSSLYRNIISKRSEDELDDVLGVSHS